MENILRNTVFFLCACLSCTSFAEVEETFTYGTQTSTEPLSFDAWNHMVYGVFPGGAASQVAGSEYSNYRADFEKRKYCKANNYPKNVSFCAAYKAKETEKCKASASGAKTLCQIDYNRAYKDELVECGKVFFSDNLLAQCNLAAKAQLDTDMLSCELSYQATLNRC